VYFHLSSSTSGTPSLNYIPYRTSFVISCIHYSSTTTHTTTCTGHSSTQHNPSPVHWLTQFLLACRWAGTQCHQDTGHRQQASPAKRSEFDYHRHWLKNDMRFCGTRSRLPRLEKGAMFEGHRGRQQTGCSKSLFYCAVGPTTSQEYTKIILWAVTACIWLKSIQQYWMNSIKSPFHPRGEVSMYAMGTCYQNRNINPQGVSHLPYLHIYYVALILEHSNTKSLWLDSKLLSSSDLQGLDSRTFSWNTFALCPAWRFSQYRQSSSIAAFHDAGDRLSRLLL
jgi:hypothetical protein